MLPVDAKHRLEELLVARGVSLRTEGSVTLGPGRDAIAAWEGFKQAATEPAYEPFVDRWGTRLHVQPESDGDLLLFEASSGSMADGFALCFRRQFAFQEDGGEYFGMNSLYLDVEFQTAKVLERLTGTHLWGCGGPPALEWAARVEVLEPFTVPFTDHSPVGFSLRQGDN